MNASGRPVGLHLSEGRRLLLLLAAVAGLALGYAAQTPPFEGPDAEGHFRYALWLQRQLAVPRLDAATAALSHELVQQPPLYYGLVALATAGMPMSDTLRVVAPNPHYPALSHRATLTPPGAPAGAEMPARVAALVALLGALLAVWATWALVRTLLPGVPGLALAAAAVVGLNPQFVFAAASVTNDTWACATVSLAVWGAAVAALRPGRLWRWWAVGVLVGLAAMTKYSSLVVALPAGLLWLWWARAQTWRARVLALAALALGFLPVAGWWYAANFAQSGELVPLTVLRTLFPGPHRSTPMSWSGAWGEAGWFTHSFWGVFGHGVLASPGYYTLVGLLVSAAVLGLLALPARIRAHPERRAIAAALVLAAVWFGAALLSWVNLIRHIRLANQGRLLFPAASALALLLVLGWWALAPVRWQRRVLAAVPIVFFTLALWQVSTLADAYRVPPALPASQAMDRHVDARFEGGIELVGLDLPAGGAVAGGAELPLRLYLRAAHPITATAVLFAHLSDDADRRLAGYDGVPVGGRHPVQQWLPGQLFADDYRLATSQVATDTLATLVVGFYDPATRRPFRLLDGNGKPVAEAARVASVVVHPQPPAPQATATALAHWANGIALTRADIRRTADGTPVGVDLAWATDQPIRRAYTLFVQLLDADGQLVSQADVKPGGDRAPTDTWLPGYPASVRVQLPPPERPWQRMILGLYDGQGRLPLAGGSGDVFELARR